MKKNLKVLIASTIVCCMLTLASCIKNDDGSNVTPKKEITSAEAEQSDDVNEEIAVTNETLDIISEGFTGSGMRIQKLNEDTCSVTSVLDNSTKTITFTFNGTNCPGTRVREGVVTARLISATSWHSAGGKIEVIYKNYKITRKIDGKSILFNGRMLLTNVNGALSANIVHLIHGTLRLKLDLNSNTERVWKIARKRTISYQNDEFILTLSGDSTDNICDAGVNREGKEFITKIPSDVVIKLCGTDKKIKATSGKIEHIIGPVTLTAEFGYTSLTQKATVGCDATGTLLTYVNTEKQEQASKYEAYK